MKVTTNGIILALALPVLFGCKRAQPPAASHEGYVLKASEGEKVMGNIFIKADPRTGSTHASMFTMTVAPRDFIPLHVHTLFDEFFFVHDGSGFATLGAKRIPIEKGDIIFVPKNTDHKFENPQPDQGLELVYFINEPGLEGKFREWDARMKRDSRPISLQEANEIAGKHGDIMKEAKK